jgi:hypothetical protein
MHPGLMLVSGMRVKNLNRAMQKKCSSGSWLALWERISGQNAFLCFVKDCINRPSVGGLVQMDGPADGAWYVVPLCEHCSKSTGQDLEIWDQAKLVSAVEMPMPFAAASRLPAGILHAAGSFR